MDSILLKGVWEDIKSFLNVKRHEPFYNERELQVKLASFLEQTKKYTHIYLEYYVPVKNNKKDVLLSDYQWNSEIRMDIVVNYEDSYIPVELKYKTKKVRGCKISRFGEFINDVDIIKNQSAQDIGRYDYWKDVRRIEVVNSHYDKVVGGIALFLTNDPNYYKEKTRHSSFYNFRLTNDNDGSKMSWDNNPKIKETHPDFQLDKTYSPQWLNDKETKLPEGTRCFYCLVNK